MCTHIHTYVHALNMVEQGLIHTLSLTHTHRRALCSSQHAPWDQQQWWMPSQRSEHLHQRRWHRCVLSFCFPFVVVHLCCVCLCACAAIQIMPLRMAQNEAPAHSLRLDCKCSHTPTSPILCLPAQLRAKHEPIFELLAYALHVSSLNKSSIS